MLPPCYIAWSEPRAFRYRDGLIWKDDWAWPRHAGVVAKERIIYKQYRPRSLKQWRRWKPRKESYERGFEGWKEDVESWQQAIKNNREFMCDDSISPPRIDESALPRHSEAPYLRLAKQMLHGLESGRKEMPLSLRLRIVSRLHRQQSSNDIA